ncbi:MAG: HD domain-containing protein [Pirellulaceae bacterium]|nr:HD domain-containing protein [Pirellulaceae bacterium]
MQRQFISNLQARDSVDEVYRVADKQIRSNRQGNDYILLQLLDRTGQISGLRWNAGQSIYETFHKGDYLRVLGMAQLHNGILQIIVQDFERVPPEKVNRVDFEKSQPGQSQQLLQALREILEQTTNPHLLHLVQAYFADQSMMTLLMRAPAGIKTHHAYEGGLLRHMLDLIHVAQSVAPHYPQLDAELLRVGVFLHDLGKVEELRFDGELTYTDPGQLLGHLVQGCLELERKIAQVAHETGQPFPAELAWRLQHMVISHHGQLEHGSPKVPMTLEAIVLAYLDDLDAKINQATELIESDRNTDSNWTTYHPNLGRKLFKPSLRRS